MRIGRIIGTVVATVKDSRLEGMKLLLVQPVGPDGKNDGAPLVAVDTVGAGPGPAVLFVTGPAARGTDVTRESPVDAAIVGIVDAVHLEKSRGR